MRIAILTGCVLLPLAWAPAGDKGVPARASQITHGPILGRLTANSVDVWARTDRPGTFGVRYGTQPGKLDQRSGPVATHLDRDNTGSGTLKGLKPNTRYHYDLLIGEKPTGVGGSFRTLPDPAAYRHPKVNPKGLFNFRFEFACGNSQGKHSRGPALPAFKTMLDRLHDKINFAILNGDWLYEDHRDHTVDAWRKQVGLGGGKLPHLVAVAPTVVGVWENYKVYLERGKNLAAWHRNMPSFFTFDDHEILNDVWGAGEAGVRERRAVFRDIGVQAWYDYLGWSNPTSFTQGIHFGRTKLTKGSDVLTDPAADFGKLDLKQAGTLHVHWGKPTAGVDDNKLDDEPPGDPNAGVYEVVKVLDRNRLKVRPALQADSTSSYSIGRRSYYKLRIANCDFFLLDTRGHRDMHDLDRPDKPGISMLGKEQKAWLKEGMKASDADFFFVVSSVNLMVPHVGGGAVRAKNKDDAWTVFLEEREELIRFWDGLGKPVFVLTGDLHNSFAIKVTERVWEFASGPHNSANHRVADEGGRPANGPFDSRGRKCDIRWSSYFLDDIPRDQLRHPLYCVVQVNNVFNNPLQLGQERWVAFPRPQVVVQYYDGLTGELRYAESVLGR
jgi:phosphodiesterase/alkaline phosphatase D-like protein